MIIALFIIFAYLLGSLSSAIVACRLMGLPDPRTQGSGNPGATNVMRMGAKKLAIIVLLGDALKGFLPVIIAKIVGLPIYALGYVGLAAFLGHLFPIYFGFKGGKGVATFAGVLLAFGWHLGLLSIITWLITAIISRYSSLAALIAAILIPIYSLFLVDLDLLIPITLMSVILLIRHRENIQRLMKGTESKMNFRRS